MKRLVLLIAAIAISALAHAGGLPFAVESFQKAQELGKQYNAKHVLIFYTGPN